MEKNNQNYMKLYENYMKKFKRDAKLVMMGG